MFLCYNKGTKVATMKIDRLIGILTVLLQQQAVTAPYLAEKFDVSRRTINRDIDSLARAGIPVYTTQGAGAGTIPFYRSAGFSDMRGYMKL